MYKDPVVGILFLYGRTLFKACEYPFAGCEYVFATFEYPFAHCEQRFLLTPLTFSLNSVSLFFSFP
jgi:hypothetical protein